MDTKRTRGRPKKENPLTDSIKVRMTTEDKQHWQDKAIQAGYSNLSSWLKNLVQAS